jgi:CrcB protein
MANGGAGYLSAHAIAEAKSGTDAGTVINVGALLWIALGGALGSVVRAVTGMLIPAGRLPWATIAVNIVGSFAIGWLLGRVGPVSAENLRAHSFLVVGACGGFTTFSSFSWQTFEQIQKGSWGWAAANVVLSVVLCIVATWAGWRLAR